jgi:hypothetical protein
MERLFKHLFALALISAFTMVLAGCGSAPEADPKIESSRREAAVEMRAIFNKVNGNYESLSAEDKAAFLKLCNNDPKVVEQSWNGMKNGPGGSASGPPQ